MDLDNLTNDEIRIQLVKYGFANLPVTQTTRKVLVKKLRNAIDGEKGKIRRETIAVTKFSSDEEEQVKPAKREKTPRRATIAPGEKVRKAATSTTTEIQADIPVKKTPSRRTSRSTPAKERPFVTSTASAPIIQEDTDDDIVEVPVTRRSSSRASNNTPTFLGKSDVVRTSYKSSVDIVNEDVAAEVEILDDYEEERIFDNFAKEREEISAPRKPSPIMMTQPTTRRKTITTSVSSNYASKFDDKITPSKFGRASLTTSYNPSVVSTYKFDSDQDETLQLDETNTPYLSNFAKRLSTLRAEPLDVGMEKYKNLREGPSTSTDYRTSVRYEYSPTINKSKVVQAPPKRGLMNDFQQIIDSLDRKYNLRMTLCLIFIIFVMVAILVIII